MQYLAPPTRRFTIHSVVLAAFPLIAGGCFSERSFPMHPDDLVRVSHTPADPLPQSTREWLVSTHEQLRHLLPASAHPPLLTDDLTDDQGEPIDVAAHFHLKHRKLRTLFGNFFGLSHTAQAVGSRSAIDVPDPPWPGFEQVWIPVTDDASLSGRLGFAERNGENLDADCIVILPGLFGDNSIQRTRDLAQALRACGFHVLALELRGHGQTEAKYPNIYYNFGALETEDLMTVSEWLEDQPHVMRTGLIGFCWGGNHGMLAAWYDGRMAHHLSITEKLAGFLKPPPTRRHFSAGVLAFSPVLRFAELIDELDTDKPMLIDPVLASFQKTIRRRMIRKSHPTVSGSLGDLIDHEYAKSELDYPGAVPDGLRFLRFLPYRGKHAGNKLADARIPVLIVQAANDPLCAVQNVADLIAGLDNTNVAAIILPGGGHIGFAPYAKSYYFSLIVNFFDPRTGPGTRLNTQVTLAAEMDHPEGSVPSATIRSID